MKTKILSIVTMAMFSLASCQQNEPTTNGNEITEDNNQDDPKVLVAVPIDHPVGVLKDDEGNPLVEFEPGNVDGPPLKKSTPEIDYDEFFGLKPGQKVKLSSYSGAVDPVGTSLKNDFDGDGIPNSKETTSNVWVADYPVIETEIATPVTMSIEILYDNERKEEIIQTDISAEDTTRAQDFASDEVHRNEINERTVQYVDEIATSHSEKHDRSSSVSASAEVNVWGNGAKASYSESSSSSDSFSDSFSEKKNRWKDVPFRNNVEKNGWTIKGNEASKNARNLRQEIRSKGDATTKIKPNAGYVRAALYISNRSVNMPVRLSKIRCSLMFRTPKGELISVNRFDIRNEDYSEFSVDLYGDETFGPYVIQIGGLNTAEVKDAIERGYSPKIYILDYQMTHVEDSNYRAALAENYSGDNLRIVEENAKGRTAGIRIIGPGMREFYRVVAFDSDAAESRTTQPEDVTYISPGVTLEKALNRISYSGKSFEFANYIMDFSSLKFADGTPLAENPKVLVRGIKSVNGIKNNVPVTEVIREEDGSETYVMKPAADWNKEEFETYRLWVVFAESEHYAPNADMIERDPVTGQVAYKKYVYQGKEVVWAQGIGGPDSIIWPGDHYDIVLFDFSEFAGKKEDFGHNAIETPEDETFKFNTRWKLADLGANPFRPDTHSQLLGDVACGDTVELSFKLDKTFYLNPSFGSPEVRDGERIYSDYYYNWEEISDLFDIEEALDFEVSFGLGGHYSSWFNLVRHRSPMSEYLSDEEGQGVEVVDSYWDYLEQEFTLRIRIPDNMPGVPPSGVVKLYMRPALNTAYRESIWPKLPENIKSFRGAVAAGAEKDATEIYVKNAVGAPAAGQEIFIVADDSAASYTIASVQMSHDGIYALTLESGLSKFVGEDTPVFINPETTISTPEVKISVGTTFEDDWNDDKGFDAYEVGEDGRLGLVQDNRDQNNFAKSLGFNTDYVVANWIGNNNYSNPYWNNWTDASFYYDFAKNLNPRFLETSKSSYMGFPGAYSEVDVSDVEHPIAANGYGVQSVIGENYMFVAWIGNDDKLYGQFGDIRGGGEPVWDDVIEIYLFRNEHVFVFGNSVGPDSRFFHLNVSGNNAIIAANDSLAYSNMIGNSGNYMWARLIDLRSGVFVGTDDIVIEKTGPQLVSYSPSVNSYFYQDKIVLFSNGRAVSIDLTTKSLVNEISAYDTPDAIEANCRNYTEIYCKEEGCVATRTKVGVLSVTEFELKNLGLSNPVEKRAYEITDQLFIFDGLDSKISVEDSAFTDSRAIFVWRDAQSNVYYRVRNTELDYFLGQEPLLISSHTDGDQRNPRVVIKNDKALVVWDSFDAGTGYNIRGRVIDLETGLPTEPEDFLISTELMFDQIMPEAVILNGEAFVMWQSQDVNGNYNIVGKLINVHNSAPIESTTVTISDAPFTSGLDMYKNYPRIATDGHGKAFVAWTPGTGPNIAGRFIQVDTEGTVEFQYGMNNFFTAPLVERNYDVKVNLVDDFTY